MLLLPFQINVFVYVTFPDWTKATFGLSLPIMANLTEIIRGAIDSIPTGNGNRQKASLSVDGRSG